MIITFFCGEVYFNKGSLLHFCQILNEIDEQGIKIYELPDCDSDEDEDYVEQTRQLKVQYLIVSVCCFYLMFKI